MHTLPNLPYNYNALEPHIDARTMEIHHTKHHQGYVDKLNKALEDYPELQEKPIEELLRSLDVLPDAVRSAVRNNGGGHYNHSLFWQIMAPATSHSEAQPKESLFKEEFSDAASKVFGSGWVWLVQDSNGNMSVRTTTNQDCPLSEGLKPLLCLDVWEHAYYLQYQNRRSDYIKNWWHVVNWSHVEANLN